MDVMTLNMRWVQVAATKCARYDLKIARVLGLRMNFCKYDLKDEKFVGLNSQIYKP